MATKHQSTEQKPATETAKKPLYTLFNWIDESKQEDGAYKYKGRAIPVGRITAAMEKAVFDSDPATAKEARAAFLPTDSTFVVRKPKTDDQKLSHEIIDQQTRNADNDGRSFTDYLIRDKEKFLEWLESKPELLEKSPAKKVKLVHTADVVHGYETEDQIQAFLDERKARKESAKAAAKVAKERKAAKVTDESNK